MLNKTLIELYATNVITFGNRTFAQVHETYVEAVKEFIAKNYTVTKMSIRNK